MIRVRLVAAGAMGIGAAANVLLCHYYGWRALALAGAAEFAVAVWVAMTETR